MATRVQVLFPFLAFSMVLSACGSLPSTSAVPSAPTALGAPVQSRTLMETLSSWDGKGLTYPAGTPKITALEIELAPGADTGWHLHPVPSLAYILEGQLELRLRDGSTRLLGAGQAVAEVVNTEHRGRNPGDRPTRLVVFYVGTTALPLTQPAPR
jgi:quercetin dioxygenase-like cupin family protein